MVKNSLIKTVVIFRPSDHHTYAGNLIPVNTFDPIAAELLKGLSESDCGRRRKQFHANRN